MAVLKQWLLGVIACAIMISFLNRLCAAGSMRSVSRFTGGLMLLLTMLRAAPLFSADLSASERPSYSDTVFELEQELNKEREEAFSDGIAAAAEAYIEDKARLMGLSVLAEVQVLPEQGTPVPSGVRLTGPYSRDLADAIEQELKIPKERQVWNEG